MITNRSAFKHEQHYLFRYEGCIIIIQIPMKSPSGGQPVPRRPGGREGSNDATKPVVSLMPTVSEYCDIANDSTGGHCWPNNEGGNITERNKTALSKRCGQWCTGRSPSLTVSAAAGRFV